MTQLKLLVFLTAVAAFGSGCDRSPIAPSSAARTLVSVDVVGPRAVATGETVRYRAVARFLDGSSEDVTATAQWGPPQNDRTSVYFTGPGVAVGVRPGETVAWAVLPNSPVDPATSYPRGSILVLVLDAGTFKLSGVVTDSGGGALPGVTVEVLSGTGPGQQTTTDGKGQYSLYSVAGRVRVRASAPEFAPEVQEFVVTGHGVTHSFALTPLLAPADVTGSWTMVFAPAPSCPVGLPEIVQGRSYQLELIQQGTRLRMTISGPTVTVLNSHDYGGTILGSRVRLHFLGHLDFAEFAEPDFYDHLSPTEKFGFEGTFDGAAAGSEIRGGLGGDAIYWNVDTNRNKPVWGCRSTDHVITLRR